MRFAPLHIYSAYSFLKSGLTTERIISSVMKNKYFGAAITDLGVMYGIPEFIKSMEKIKHPFVVGMEIELEGNHYGLYALNEEGYINLCKISSSIQNKSFDKNTLLEHKNGILSIVDTSLGEIKNKFEDVLLDETDLARYVNELSKMFEKFYLGVELKERNELEYVRTIRKFAKEHTYEKVAFPHIKYQNKDDAIVLTIVEAIANDEKITKKSETGNECFLTLEDYQRIYAADEMENTCKIIEMSTFNFHKKRGEMLHFTKSKSDTYLKTLCFDALKEKGLADNPLYIERLNYELDVIHSMGYDDYFLLVQDYVNWARSQNILVGLRGSAAGSLVTHLLGIAPLDPIENNLNFERFLNPARKTMPDIDIDFMDSRRNEVIEYCREKYGRDKVANIITYQSILAKQSLRDIGRIYDYPTRHIDLLSKTLSDPKLSLRESYRKIPAFKELVDSDKYFLEIVSFSSKIEGLIRQSGLHAAGIILNSNPISDILPVTYDLSDNIISQYEMGYLEEQGILKMDFLCLTHLSVVASCVELINERHPDAKLDLFHLPYDDEKTYEIIRSLQTMGIFQLESSGMKNAIKIIKPTTFNDVAALLALFRPGPMREIKSYSKRKAGLEPIPKMSKDQEKILGQTYGIIVYQEQISELAVAMAGMKMSDADNFRWAVSKKKIELLSSMKEAFINGSINNGYSKEEATDYYDRIEKFAFYGFNKSHAYGYALLSCQMAYLKAYYPLEFYSIILKSSSSTNDTKFNEYISEMKKRNIMIVSPNINRSSFDFEICDEGILFPLNAIRGINILTSEKIVEERKNGDFSDFFDFVGRMFIHKINESQISRLIDAGAFDELHPSRTSLRNSIQIALQYAELAYDENGQLSLSLGLEKPALVESKDDPIDNLDKEYEAIGIMLSDNPLRYKKEIIERENIYTIEQALLLEEENYRKTFKVAGIVRNKKVINTKAGSPMAFVKIFDETSEMEVIFFPMVYKDAIRITDKNNIIAISGHFEDNKGEKSFIGESVSLLEEIDHA